MIADKVLSVNWVWSVESSVSYELSHSRGHEGPIVAQPPYLERLKSWHVARPSRHDLSRPDVKLPLFENIYDYDVDAIMIDLFQYCVHETHAVPDVKTAAIIANRKFRAANMKKASSIVAHEAQMLPTSLNGINVYVSHHCPRDRVYVLTHKEDAGALSKNGIRFGMGIWHPSVCIGFSTNIRPTNNLLDLMVGPDED